MSFLTAVLVACGIVAWVGCSAPAEAPPPGDVADAGVAADAATPRSGADADGGGQDTPGRRGADAGTGGSGDSGGAAPATEEPPPGFLQGPDATWGTLRFKGLVNGEDAAAAGKGTQGIGLATVHLDGEDTEVSANLVASHLVFPDDYATIAMRGDAYVRLEASVPVDTTQAGGTWLYFGAGLSVDALLAAAEDPAQGAPLGPWGWFELYDLEVQVRRDGLVLSRSCLRSRLDYDSDASRIWLDPGSGGAFEAGDDLLVWVMADMQPPAVITPDTEASLCLFSVGGAPVGGDVWRAASVEDPAALDCSLPDGYLALPAGDAMVLRFVGPLNDLDAPPPDLATGLSFAEVRAGGELLAADGYRALAGRYVDPATGDPVLYVQTIGGLSSLWADEYHFVMTETTVDAAAARAPGEDALVLRNDAVRWEDADGLRYATVVQQVTERIREGVAWYRRCPVAATDLAAPGSSVLVCRSGAVGTEPATLQIATRQALTTDPAVLSLATGVEAPCWCTREEEVVDCDAFEALP